MIGKFGEMVILLDFRDAAVRIRGMEFAIYEF
jgi:hypothetical protein